MTAQAPQNFVEWWQSLPVGPVFSGPNGQLDGLSLGSVMDAETSRLKQSAKVSFPTYAPADALSHIGGDRVILQGSAETAANYRIRLKDAWSQWSRAGNPVGLLEQLWYTGFERAVIVTQNGLAYQLSAAPTPGVDPTPLLTVTNLGTLGTAMHSNVTLSRSIPAGNSWWTFDSNTDLCSRFAVIWYGAQPSTFYTHARATFTGTEDGSVANPWPSLVWNNAFPTTTYLIQAGPPVVTSGPTAMPVMGYDPSTQTITGVASTSSGPFVGYCDYTAYQVGANPLADPHPADLSRLRSVIATWRPGEAACVGMSVAAQGAFWGWPVETWGSGGTWGASTVVAFAP